MDGRQELECQPGKWVVSDLPRDGGEERGRRGVSRECGSGRKC